MRIYMLSENPRLTALMNCDQTLPSQAAAAMTCVCNNIPLDIREALEQRGIWSIVQKDSFWSKWTRENGSQFRWMLEYLQSLTTLLGNDQYTYLFEGIWNYRDVCISSFPPGNLATGNLAMADLINAYRKAYKKSLDKRKILTWRGRVIPSWWDTLNTVEQKKASLLVNVNRWDI